MESLIGRFKNLIALAAILFAQIIGLALQVKLPSQQGSTRLIRFWAVAAVSPLEKGVIHVQQWVADTWYGYLYLRGVRKENAQLRQEIDNMKIQQARMQEDADMARRIQALLRFKEDYVDSTVAAQIIGTGGSDQSRVLYIDKGSDNGLRPDMAVITPTGVVGKIVQVFPDAAQVQPINDQLAGVGAALKNSRLQGIIKGAPDGTTTLQYIMSDEKVDVGEEVITSGGDHIFPKGLPIGTVEAVKPGTDLFWNIRVKPSANLSRLEEVLVVTKMSQRQPDTKDLGPIRAADILAERLPTFKTAEEKAAAAAAAAGGAASSTGTTAGAATTGKPSGTTPAPGATASTGTATPKPGGAGAPRPNTAANGTLAPRPATAPHTTTTPGAANGLGASRTPGLTGTGAGATHAPAAGTGAAHAGTGTSVGHSATATGAANGSTRLSDGSGGTSGVPKVSPGAAVQHAPGATTQRPSAANGVTHSPSAGASGTSTPSVVHRPAPAIAPGDNPRPPASGATDNPQR